MTKIILDACNNHLNNRDIIIQMIRTAAELGADYVKFQVFKADHLNKDYPNYKETYTNYKKLELTESDYSDLLVLCKMYGIKCMFTVFHKDFVDHLYNCGASYIKIASPEADNVELLKAIILKGFSEIFISCGMIDYNRIRFLRERTRTKLLYCVSMYPTHLKDIDFDEMRNFDGFSDHTIGIQAAKKAIDLDIGYIERHFTLGKYLPGKDHFFSSTPDEVKELIEYRDFKENIKNYKRRFKT